jgi:hypothetical protein
MGREVADRPHLGEESAGKERRDERGGATR